LTLRPRELGKLELYLIYNTAGEWESSWRALQDHEVAALFTVVTKTVMDQALVGWTKPLVDALGVQPQGALRKLPVVARECDTRTRCSLYAPNECHPTAKKMPWCYTPGGLVDDELRRLVSEAINLWREGVYVVVVTQEKKP
jgi:hypothetical protein